MGGLEKIIGHIREESEIEAKTLLETAEKEAASLKKDAEEKALSECERIAKKSEQEVRNIIERGNSSAELKKKQLLLAKKQELINEMIGKAEASLYEMDEKAYFEALTKLFRKHALGRDGKISFGGKDLKRLPAELLDSFAAIAKEKGGSIVLSEAPAEIEGGFLLNYGGVEENCSFRALIDDEMERLQDQVQKVLFA